MLKKIYYGSLLLSFFSLLSACASSPPDFHACTEISFTEGWCAQVVSGHVGYVNEKQTIVDTIQKKPATWWDLRPTMVQIPYFDYVDLKAWIITTCKRPGMNCSSAITSWDRTLGDMNTVIDSKMGKTK